VDALQYDPYWDGEYEGYRAIAGAETPTSCGCPPAEWAVQPDAPIFYNQGSAEFRSSTQPNRRGAHGLEGEGSGGGILRAMPLNLDDLEPLARERLDRSVFDYITGGAEDEWTLRENRAAFVRWVLRPRVLVDMARVDLGTTVLGTTLALPVLCAPTALHRLCHPDGELASARAAHAAGTIFTVGTLSSCAIEEIRAVTPGPLWFQLYLYKDWGINRMLVDRAVAAGALALVLTVDTVFLGRRERDLRNDYRNPPGIVPRHLEGVVDLAARAGHGAKNVFPAEDLRERSFTWKDLERLRALSSMPLVLKGIVTREDARCAADAGADAVVVSNHGGRQLDGSIATLDALPEVAEALGGRRAPTGRPMEVLMDGGIRRGTHVIKALALGARAVLVGRPLMYALAAGGEEGVVDMFRLVKEELEVSLGLTGCASVRDVRPEHVRPAAR
jgi:4-hydroxymandelate oxidase